MAALEISYPPNIPDVPNNSQDFIDRLEQKKVWAESHVNRINNHVANLTSMRDELQEHKTLIDAYWANIQATNNLAKEVRKALLTTKTKAFKVGQNSQWTIKAIQSLIADVRNTLDAVEALRDLVADLLDRIDKLNDPGLDRTKSLYKMLLDFKGIVDTTLTKVSTAVEKTLDALKSALALDNGLNDNHEGIQTQLQDMVTHLKTGTKPGLEDPDLPEYGPIPTFPLEDCDDDYYDRLKAETTRLAEDFKKLEDMLRIATDQQYILTSRRDVIGSALQAAKDARGQS